MYYKLWIVKGLNIELDVFFSNVGVELETVTITCQLC